MTASRSSNLAWKMSVCKDALVGNMGTEHHWISQDKK